MYYFKSITKLVIIFFVILFCSKAFAISQYKLAMLGYNQKEINEILSGAKSLSQINTERKKKMLGYSYNSQLFVPHIIQKPFKKQNKKKTVPISPENSPIIDDNKTTQKFKIYYQTNEKKDPQIKKRIISNGYNYKLINLARPYFSIIEEASQVNNIKISIILAIIKVESGFNHLAISPKGALGLMQLMPETAKSLGVTNPFNPSQNIHGGTKYFAYCLKSLNNLKLAIAAYNAGLSRVEKNFEIPPFTETQNFVKDVLHYEKVYEQLVREL